MPSPQADTPRFDRLFRDSPWTTLEASGRAVGLPRNQMGNSEVGHLNIGAGRIVDQDIVRIGKAVSRHELEANPTLVDAVKQRQARFTSPDCFPTAACTRCRRICTD